MRAAPMLLHRYPMSGKDEKLLFQILNDIPDHFFGTNGFELGLSTDPMVIVLIAFNTHANEPVLRFPQTIHKTTKTQTMFLFRVTSFHSRTTVPSQSPL
jgi:hypothetical protein